jgi:hypothetical protein
VLLSALEQEP